MLAVAPAVVIGVCWEVDTAAVEADVAPVLGVCVWTTVLTLDVTGSEVEVSTVVASHVTVVSVEGYVCKS